MEKRLDGKVFLITGASSGMGKAVTARFLEEGARAVAVGRDEKRMEQWKKDPRVRPVIGDITENGMAERMAGAAKETFGRLDGICNAAGINDLSYPLLETDDERWDRVLETDLKAPFRIIRAAVPLLVESGGGSIVNIGSYAALRGNHGPSYTAAKAGLEGLTKSVAFGFAKQNIRCNIIHPGGTRTNIGVTSGGKYHEAQGALSKLIMDMPVNWFGYPEDIANVCLFLCSEEAKWINGAVISVDGGMSVC
ncbi:SDR family NAD(P)-dependent oxidoreductase [Qiania dongpingensis]|uniref:SDR family oxidoreductase n=1 Tax=Qiania dongpingensis TaxID=2763669 RepID=A0A7G9G7J7_9FIRM|nr:SDR family oxidoreductase [Qiania dongpingensis]QNM06779.1 SDR family oxidoreductase [Qiania dongpingensis]